MAKKTQNSKDNLLIFLVICIVLVLGLIGIRKLYSVARIRQLPSHPDSSSSLTPFNKTPTTQIISSPDENEWINENTIIQGQPTQDGKGVIFQIPELRLQFELPKPLVNGTEMNKRYFKNDTGVEVGYFLVPPNMKQNYMNLRFRLHFTNNTFVLERDAGFADACGFVQEGNTFSFSFGCTGGGKSIQIPSEAFDRKVTISSDMTAVTVHGFEPIPENGWVIFPKGFIGAVVNYRYRDYTGFTITMNNEQSDTTEMIQILSTIRKY